MQQALAATSAQGIGMTPRDVTRGLAWFGIGLSLAELLAPQAVARVDGLERLLQAFGVREIASGGLTPPRASWQSSMDLPQSGLQRGLTHEASILLCKNGPTGPETGSPTCKARRSLQALLPGLRCRNVRHTGCDRRPKLLTEYILAHRISQDLQILEPDQDSHKLDHDRNPSERLTLLRARQSRQPRSGGHSCRPLRDTRTTSVADVSKLHRMA